VCPWLSVNKIKNTSGKWLLGGAEVYRPWFVPGLFHSPIGQCTIVPVSFELGGDWPEGLYLAHRAIATPCGEPGAHRLTLAVR
jgi:hypothetical protein